jgi:2-C-methyl-D-erythritol 4-phosphate cytidylyltransferase
MKDPQGVFAAVITAAGSSARMKGVKKEYRLLPAPADGSLTVLGAAVSAFVPFPFVKLVITVPPDTEHGSPEHAAAAALPSGLAGDPRILFVLGGRTRRESVHNALSRLAVFNPGYVLIHDGARPWVSAPLIQAVMDAVRSYGAAVPALPLVETPKEIERTADGAGVPQAFIKRHLRRRDMVTVQTPQGFVFQDILEAHEKASEKERGGFEYTDDAEVWGEFRGPVAVIPGETKNRKITFPEDLACYG